MPSRPGLLLPLATTLALAAACSASSSANRSAVAADTPPTASARPPEPAPVVQADAPDPSDPVAPYPLTLAPPPEPRLSVRPSPPPAPGPYGVQVVDETGRTFPTFGSGGRTYVMGTTGSRYSIVLRNPTATRVEAVVSVDGIDAADGQSADYVHKRGYILPAYGSTTIEGFRTSYSEVATFRFSSVADSYAGRLGEARDVGVIGVAFFPERAPVAIARDSDDMPHPRYHAPARAYPSRMAPPAPPATPALGGAGGAAPAPAAAEAARGKGVNANDRPGLGTEFGEARESRVGSTSFDRANTTTPLEVAVLRYNDRAGLTALGVIPKPVYRLTELELRETAEPFPQQRFAVAPP